MTGALLLLFLPAEQSVQHQVDLLELPLIGDQIQQHVDQLPQFSGFFRFVHGFRSPIHFYSPVANDILLRLEVKVNRCVISRVISRDITSLILILILYLYHTLFILRT